MQRNSIILVAVLFLLEPAAAVAGDLTKTDRTIAKEPVYRGSPEYCLLVFGADAKARVWLVIDGDFLYVDRNANGDLTEKDEKIEAVKIDDYRHFQASSVKAGSVDYSDLTVVRMRRAKGEPFIYLVGIQMQNPFARGGGADGGGQLIQTAGADRQGRLHFAGQSKKAPIVHFNGPWTMELQVRPNLAAGHLLDLETGVGTPGLGPGTFAFINFDSVIPRTSHPVVEIEFPAKAPSKEVIRGKFEIHDRC